jgi:hypothetical protein
VTTATGSSSATTPDQAERDAAVRARLVAQLEELIAGTDSLSPAERGGLEGSLAAKPGLKRFLRVTPGGLLRTDKAKISTEENLDGKYLLRCFDPHMTTEDIALGYKQLLEVGTRNPLTSANTTA